MLDNNTITTDEDFTTLAYDVTDAASKVTGNILQPTGAIRVIYILIGTLGILGNALVIVVIFSLTNLRKKLTNAFIIHQSIVDFLASVVLLIISLAQKQYRVGGAAGEILCRVWLNTYALWILYTTSTFNLCALTLERYFGIVHPIKHKLSFTKAKVAGAMVTSWILSIVGNIYNPITSGTIDGMCFTIAFWPSRAAQRTSGIINFIAKYFIPLAIMIFCYSRILMVIRSRIAPSNPTQGPGSQATASTTAHKFTGAKRNTIKTLIIVSCCFVLCWSWNQFFYLALNLGATVDFSSNFYNFTVVAVFVNCCINPFVYIFKYEEFKQGLRQLFLCKSAASLGVGDSSSGHSKPGTSSVVVSGRHPSTLVNSHSEIKQQQ